ncbi:hypothetical protein [Natrialbaceae archaeon AArc-T1-2]|uniref:hypothetical protein n=1 Tax=Natrialbaceae archaeon AArc-T1-2 TaxID=3053904 RepID=UPI003D2F70EB
MAEPTAVPVTPNPVAESDRRDAGFARHVEAFDEHATLFVGLSNSERVADL